MRRRAVKDEQKHERGLAIREMAWQQFQAASYADVTIAGVAAALDLAKGTVYLYYKTKEELFLAVVTAQLEGWFTTVDAQLAAMSPDGPIAQVVAITCAALERHPGLTRLLAILHTLLEQNIDLTTATQFKHFLLTHFTRTGALLEQRLAFLAPGDGARLLLRAHALVIGLTHVADPAPVVKTVLAKGDFAVFVIDFAGEFAATLTALLLGMERQSPQENH